MRSLEKVFPKELFQNNTSPGSKKLLFLQADSSGPLQPSWERLGDRKISVWVLRDSECLDEWRADRVWGSWYQRRVWVRNILLTHWMVCLAVIPVGLWLRRFLICRLNQLQRKHMCATYVGLRGRSAGKKSVCKAGDTSAIPGSGRSPGEGIDYHSSILGLPWWFRW